MSKKVVIILLVLTGVLFFLALGSNLLPSSRQDKDSFDPEDSWVSGLGDLLSPFNKKLPASRLTPRARCWVGDRRYRLADSNQCKIAIAPAIGSDGKIEEGEWSLALEIKEDIVIKVPCRETTESRGLNPSMAMKLNREKAKVAQIGRVLGSGQIQVSLLTMHLQYIPKGGKQHQQKCEQKSPARLIVFGKGGELQLVCPKCDKNRNINITLK